MSTVNISLPSNQANHIDQMVKQYGFANRSEFIRSIIRLVIYQPELVKTAAVFPFISPKEKSVKKIASAFAKTGKYSEGFLKDLTDGLENSDYFK